MKKFLLLAPLALSAQLHNGSQTVVGTVNYCADAGSNDTYVCSISPAIPALTTGAAYAFRANTINTGAATINFNSLGAKTIKKHKDSDLADGDIKAGQLVNLVYDGTYMQMQSQLGNAPAGGGGSAPTVISAAGEGFWQPFFSQGTYWFPQSSDREVWVWQMTLPFKATFSKVAITRQAGTGTGCSGGTCGIIVGLYDNTCGSLLAYGRVVSGGSPDANATGPIVLSFAGGAVTFDAGTYYIAVSSDASPLAIWATDGAYWSSLPNASTNRWGLAANKATGNGNSLAFPGTCGSISTGSYKTPPIILWER